MNQPLARSNVQPPPRRGFTLIELLVVIAIIALLASMALVAYGRSGENAKLAGTKTLIRELDSALKERIESFRRAKLASASFVAFPPQAWKNPSLAETVYRAVVLRESFPQRGRDLLGVDGSAAGINDNAPLYFVLKSKLGLTHPQMQTLLTNTATSSPPAQVVSSAELLYLALSEGTNYGLPAFDVEGINPKYVQDADGDTLNEFIDGWGQPLRFYNAPTALLRPNGNELVMGVRQDIQYADYANARYLVTSLPPWGPNTSMDVAWDDYTSPFNVDTYDPIGLVGLQFTTYFPGVNFELQFRSVDTYSAPLIVSGGPDEQTGLLEPDDATSNYSRLGLISNVSAIYDDLTNLQRGGF